MSSLRVMERMKRIVPEHINSNVVFSICRVVGSAVV
jgi:hypothetical protein